MKFLKSISDKSYLFGIFMIKKCVVFNLTFLGTLKDNCLIKTLEMFNFMPLINNSVTIGLSFLLLIISAIIWSNTINTFLLLLLLFYLDSILQYFCKHLAYHLSIK